LAVAELSSAALHCVTSELYLRVFLSQLTMTEATPDDTGPHLSVIANPPQAA
jgi:hypothetical protein